MQAERNSRSIIVGNIPGDIPEDQLRSIFTEFGNIITFRFFCDTAVKDLGCAFCEYETAEMASQALGLNNYELKGFNLKVTPAGSQDVSVPEDDTEPDSADPEASSSNKPPEAISKAVASLPAEQMFELMKQMKMCIENNPHEARNLLLQNPQLAYALLQAQVIMRIVDPEVAMKILDRHDTEEQDTANSQSVPSSNVGQSYSGGQQATPSLSLSDPRFGTIFQGASAAPVPISDPSVNRPFDPRFRPTVEQGLQPNPDPRLMADPRSIGVVAGHDPSSRLVGSLDPRLNVSDPRVAANMMKGAMDPRGNIPPMDRRVPPPPFDPRKQPPPIVGMPVMPPQMVPPPSAMPPGILGMPPGPIPFPPPGTPALPQDQEKAALIMQVLQLSEDQISLLPPEQRQSILMLKDQIARSQMPLG